MTLLHAETVEDQVLANQFFAVAARVDGHQHLDLGEHLSILQAAWDARNFDVIAKLPVESSSLSRIEQEFIALDLLAEDYGAGSEQWVNQLNASVFAPRELSSVYLEREGRTPYDGLASNPSQFRDDGPLITVVMTTFRRHDEILTSVHSILRQSWSNLELLVIDDASGPEFESLLEELESLDVRIRVIRQSENSGTYVCRNRALGEARGEFITFQDDDDWSHPERLERQVLPMLADGHIHSTLSYCVRATEDLHFRYGAVTATRMNSSSLMFRSRDIPTLVGFDTVRKAGDSEFIRRLCEALPGEQKVLTEILAIVRLTLGSLSRTDFGAGWNHPSRSEYWEAAKWWHEQVGLGADPSIDSSQVTRSFPAPRRFVGKAQVDAMRSKYDVVIVGDFSTTAPWASVAWNQLQYARQHQGAVGIIHLNAPARPTGRPTRIAPEVRALIHTGAVERILPTDEVSIDTLFVCDASVLELQDVARWKLECGRAFLLADSPPAESGGRSFWSVNDVIASLERMFGITATEWISGDADVCSTLQAEGQRVHEMTPAFSLHANSMNVAKRYPRAVPVLGRLAPSSAGGWPADREEFKRAYPDSRYADVRILGDVRSLRQARHQVPPRWIWFNPVDYRFSLFVQQVDFYVYFGDEPPSAAEFRGMLSVMAAGRVVVIEDKYAGLFGGAAVSCSIEDVRDTIGTLHRDSEGYVAQVGVARRIIESSFGESAVLPTLVWGTPPPPPFDAAVGARASR
jgi:hypothetical protein